VNDTKNRSAAGRASGRHLLENARQYYSTSSLRESLLYLLTDLRHFCAVTAGMDFEECLRISRDVFENETPKQ
jgi:hypothetical protein